jgi:hypothetical protein
LEDFFLGGGVDYDIMTLSFFLAICYPTFNLTLVKNTKKLQKVLMNH